MTYPAPTTTPICSVRPRTIGGTTVAARPTFCRDEIHRSMRMRATIRPSGSQRFVASATTPRIETVITTNTICTSVKTPKIAANTTTPSGNGPTSESSSGVLRAHSRTTVTTPSPTLSTGNSRKMLPGDQPSTMTP